MRTLLALQMAGLVGALALATVNANAEVQFSAGLQISTASDFYQPLTPYGSWVSVGSYGRCWHPVNITAGWRPYCNGQWVWTDCGWYWQSEEPWSWACYHYGSWVNDPGYGWCWVPGTEWAPAWVTWRNSPDYIGWAPCGPGGAVLSASLFTFVGVGHFHDQITPRNVIVNNTTIINRTTVINNFSRETRDIGGVQRRVVVNNGPGIDPIRRATGQAPPARPITQVAMQTRVPEGVQRRSDAPAQNQGAQRTQEPTRTGQEQPRNYQQPANQQPSQPPPRNYEQPRNVQPQQPPAQQPRTTPEQPRTVQPGTATPQTPTPSQPPTGGQQPRQYQVPNQPPPREAPRTEPNAQQTPPAQQQVTPRTPNQQAPARPQGPPAGEARGQQQGDGKEKQQHNGNEQQ